MLRGAAGGQWTSKMMALYERWRTVADEHRDELALRDLASDVRWTFAELAAHAERGSNEPGPAAFPQGAGAGFILSVLRAWRAGQVVCPLEPDQPRPDVPWPDAPIVHVKTTSATTGRPRLIAFTAEQLAADAANLTRTMGLRPEWPNLAVISSAHSYGFSNFVTPLLLQGIPLILGVAALPEAIRLAARDEAGLTLPGVPALWRMWHEAKAIPSNTRLAISAGAPLPIALETAVYEATGIKIHNFYGSSECGGIAYDATSTPRQEAALAGAPIENVTLAVAEDGCLEVRGHNVAEGYWPEPAPALRGGVFRTCDLGSIRNGRVYVTGRAGDVIHVAGRKVAPESIERELLRHPEVREAAVLGVLQPDAHEETIAAVVVCDARVTEGALRQFLLERLPAWQVPRLWRIQNESLTNARGKIARAQWRRAFV